MLHGIFMLFMNYFGKSPHNNEWCCHAGSSCERSTKYVLELSPKGRIELISGEVADSGVAVDTRSLKPRRMVTSSVATTFILP
jgi:hypothetical protein